MKGKGHPMVLEIGANERSRCVDSQAWCFFFFLAQKIVTLELLKVEYFVKMRIFLAGMRYLRQCFLSLLSHSEQPDVRMVHV